MKDTCKLVILALILVICILITFLTGCKTRYIATEPQIVEVPRIEHHYQNTTSIDTIFQRDSIMIYQLGDTIYHNTVHNYYHTSHKTDTVNHTDTITVVKKVNVPYPVPVELSAWQKTKIDVGGFVIWGFGILSVVGIIAFVFRKKILSFIKRK